jgi:hypothetical protein
VLPKLSEVRLPRTPAGSPSRMLRFTWHVVTVTQLGFGVLLTTLAVAPGADARTVLLRWLAGTFLAATALALWSNRHHLGAVVRFPLPLVFVLVAAMCWLASA